MLARLTAQDQDQVRMQTHPGISIGGSGTSLGQNFNVVLMLRLMR